jgi:hypothetical protein
VSACFTDISKFTVLLRAGWDRLLFNVILIELFVKLPRTLAITRFDDTFVGRLRIRAQPLLKGVIDLKAILSLAADAQYPLTGLRKQSEWRVQRGRKSLVEFAPVGSSFPLRAVSQATEEALKLTDALGTC